jgi:transcriptional regulator with XRE-family HTH domain
MHIGQVIYGLRTERNLRQEALALEVNTATSNLSRIEQGKSSPSIALLERLAAALGTSVTAIYARAEGIQLAPNISATRDESSDYSRDAVQLRQGFRDLNSANKRLALEFIRMLGRLQHDA